MATDREVRAAAQNVVREFTRTQRQILRQPDSELDGWLSRRKAKQHRTMYRLFTLLTEDDFQGMSQSRPCAQIEAALIAFRNRVKIPPAKSTEVRQVVVERTSRDALPVSRQVCFAALERGGQRVVAAAGSTTGQDRDRKREERRDACAGLIVTLFGVRMTAQPDDPDPVVLDACRAIAQALIAHG